MEESLQFNLKSPYFLITFHPVTMDMQSSESQLKELFFSLRNFQDYRIIFTKANSDNEGRIINSLIDNFVNQNKNRAIAFSSMGQLRYLSAMKYCKMVIGNSSSGIIEAPYFNKPTVNIGNRQKGRIFYKSVICCLPESNSITDAIRRGLEFEFYKENCAGKTKLYGVGNAAEKIKQILLNIDYKSLLNKEFFDLDFQIINKI